MRLGLLGLGRIAVADDADGGAVEVARRRGAPPSAVATAQLRVEGTRGGAPPGSRWSMRINPSRRQGAHRRAGRRRVVGDRGRATAGEDVDDAPMMGTVISTAEAERIRGQAGAGRPAHLASRRRTPAQGWGSSSSHGRTSRPCRTACGSLRTPATTLQALSSTSGTSSALTPRSPTSGLSRCTCGSPPLEPIVR